MTPEERQLFDEMREALDVCAVTLATLAEYDPVCFAQWASLEVARMLARRTLEKVKETDTTPGPRS